MISQHASPSVMAIKLLGGVDQATLRQSLSSHRNITTPTEYLADAEIWTYSTQLRDMEGLQQDIINSDIQVHLYYVCAWCVCVCGMCMVCVITH